MDVVVADDGAGVRVTLRGMFSRRGVNVIEAANGAEAIERLSGAAVDVVITDLVMPQAGGREAIETTNRELDGAYAETHLDVTPGQGCSLFRTPGMGMYGKAPGAHLRAVLHHEGSKQGDRLGLSTVFDYSEKGQGTTFRIDLPRWEGAEPTVVSAPDPGRLRGWFSSSRTRSRSGAS